MDENINPNKIFHKNTRQEVEPKKKKREVVLRIPHGAIKWALIILFLTLIFFAGRWSANYSFGTSNDDVNKTIVPEINETVQEVELAEPEPIPEEEPEEETEPQYAVINSYSYVKLSLSDVGKVWKGDWGQITYLDIEIENNEDGIVKPEYLVLHVAGYNEPYDLETVELQPGFKEILPGRKLSGSVILNHPFSYSGAVIKNLNTVEISITLYDKSDKLIAKTTKTFNLKG